MIRNGNKRIGRSIVKNINVSSIYLGPKLVWGREVELIQMFKAFVISDGGIFDEDLFTTEFFRVHQTIRNEAIVLIVCGAYKAGIIYGINCITGQAVPFTFGRASIGTYIDKSGNIQTAGNNIPRIDYDPVSGALRGYLLENGITNLITNSLLNGNTTGWNLSQVGISYNTGTTSYGRLFNTISKLDTNNSGRAISSTSINSAAGMTYAFRTTFRAGTSTTVSIGIGGFPDGTGNPIWGVGTDTNFRVVSGPGSMVRATGALVNVIGLSTTQDTIVEVYRKYNNASIPIIFYIYPGGSSSTTLGASVLFSTPQAEINSLGVCTSQIDTSAGQATRAADSLTSADLLNASEFSIYFEGSKLGSGSNGILSRLDGSGRAFYNATDANVYAIYDGTTIVQRPETGSNGLVRKALGSFGAGGMKLITSSDSVVTSGPYSGSFGTPGGLNLGNYGLNRIQNHIRDFAIIPRQLTDAEHIAITRP